MLRRIISSVKRRIPRRWKELYWRLPEFQSTVSNRFHRTRKLFQVVGLWNVPILLSWLADWENRAGRVEIRLPRYHYAFAMRGGTSDLAVFSQVFLDDQYADLPIRDPHVIIDAGANIGLTSLYFLREYPNARVIALEPDPDNFEIARRNLSPYGERCQLILGALWSHRTRLILDRSDKHWATKVREGDGEVEGYSIKDLIDQHHLVTIDLLKADIEGSEAVVFANASELELRLITCCAIELHGQECERIFLAAIGPHGFQCYRRGELTIAIRPLSAQTASRT
jgi:FkbM family methyltransferase